MLWLITNALEAMQDAEITKAAIKNLRIAADSLEAMHIPSEAPPMQLSDTIH